jgi:hypothetical protein
LQHSNTKKQSKKAAGFSKTLTDQISKGGLLFEKAGERLRKKWRAFWGKQTSIYWLN